MNFFLSNFFIHSIYIANVRNTWMGNGSEVQSVGIWDWAKTGTIFTFGHFLPVSRIHFFYPRNTFAVIRCLYTLFCVCSCLLRTDVWRVSLRWKCREGQSTAGVRHATRRRRLHSRLRRRGYGVRIHRVSISHSCRLSTGRNYGRIFKVRR